MPDKISVPTRSILAAIVLWAVEEVSEKTSGSGIIIPNEVALSSMIVVLKRQHGLDTQDVSIRADIGEHARELSEKIGVPLGGWISDDLCSFLGHFELFGLAFRERESGKFEVHPKAIELCNEILEKDSEKGHAEDIRALREALRTYKAIVRR